MPEIPPLSGKGCSAWHTFLVGGQELPGVATVEGGKGYKIDEKAGLGEDDGTLTVQGKDIPSFTVTLRTYNPEHVDALVWWLELLFPGGAPTPDAFRVSHPGLALLGITVAYFKAVTVPKPMPAPEQKRLEVKFTCVSARAAKPMRGGAKTPKGGVKEFPNVVDKKSLRAKAAKKTPPKVTPPKLGLFGS